MNSSAKTIAGIGILGLLMITTPAQSNDFPTLDRALYIQECIALRHGQNYETLYACVCTIDHIAAVMTHQEFIEADSYMRMRNVRGERGGIFRSTKRAREIRQRFVEIKTKAEARCFSAQMGLSGDSRKE